MKKVFVNVIARPHVFMSSLWALVYKDCTIPDDLIIVTTKSMKQSIVNAYKPNSSAVEKFEVWRKLLVENVGNVPDNARKLPLFQQYMAGNETTKQEFKKKLDRLKAMINNLPQKIFVAVNLDYLNYNDYLINHQNLTVEQVASCNSVNGYNELKDVKTEAEVTRFDFYFSALISQVIKTNENGRNLELIYNNTGGRGAMRHSIAMTHQLLSRVQDRILTFNVNPVSLSERYNDFFLPSIANDLIISDNISQYLLLYHSATRSNRAIELDNIEDFLEYYASAYITPSEENWISNKQRLNEELRSEDGVNKIISDIASLRGTGPIKISDLIVNQAFKLNCNDALDGCDISFKDVGQLVVCHEPLWKPDYQFLIKQAFDYAKFGIDIQHAIKKKQSNTIEMAVSCDVKYRANSLHEVNWRLTFARLPNETFIYTMDITNGNKLSLPDLCFLAWMAYLKSIAVVVGEGVEQPTKETRVNAATDILKSDLHRLLILKCQSHQPAAFSSTIESFSEVNGINENANTDIDEFLSSSLLDVKLVDNKILNALFGITSKKVDLLDDTDEQENLFKSNYKRLVEHFLPKIIKLCVYTPSGKEDETYSTLEKEANIYAANELEWQREGAFGAKKVYSKIQAELGDAKLNSIMGPVLCSELIKATRVKDDESVIYPQFSSITYSESP